MRQKIERGLLCLGLVWLLAACGGGGGTSTPPPAVVVPPPTVGASGGTVSEASGASVIVPAGALVADTTIRVAMDSTGAPALPDGLVAAGNTYIVTPHGGAFAQSVEVRIPAPNVTLLPTQELKLAKAQPGGQWELLGDSVLTNDVLSANVLSFSYFLPVVVTYQLPIAQAVALQVRADLTCADKACSGAIGIVTATYTVATNSGQLPANCSAGQLEIQDGAYRSSFDLHRIGVGIPPGGGSVTRTLPPPTSGVYDFVVGLRCGAFQINFNSLLNKAVSWRNFYVPYPAIWVASSPTQLDVVDGLSANLETVLIGGASQLLSSGLYAPAVATDRAVIDWQRSDDAGASWRPIARSYQDEANPTPWGGDGIDWKYWSVSHGFIAAASDQNALIRVYACYLPPDVPASPCVTGPSTRLNVLLQSALPAITAAPRSLLILTGQTASLSATASGAPAPTLQWQTRAANSAGAWADVSSGTGATTGNYTTTALALADNGTQYRVVAMNALGSVQSVPVTVSVSDLNVAPTLTTQPANLGVTVGNDAVFAVAAHGTEALSYLWRFNGAPITGANSPVLRLAAVSAGQAGSYSVDVSNSAGAVSSNAATLVVTAGAPAVALPSIVTQPAALMVSSGDSATFAVGSNASSFQWRKDGVNIASATSAALTLSNVSAADVGVYSVVVSNGAGSVTSGNAALTLSVAPAPVITAPSITTQPATLVVLPGAATTLAIAASGTGPLTYQWSLNGAPISGATGAVLYLPSVTSLDAGNYTVSVGNSAGSAGSNAAQLILVGAPSLTAQPGNASAFVGATASFSVTAAGNSPLYQWTRNNVAIVGATLASYTTPTLALSDNGAVYGVIVYNGAGLVFSQAAALTVTPLVAPSFSIQPANQSVIAPAAASLTVAAGGSPTPTLKWQLSSDGGGNWTDITGANSATYTKVATSVADSGGQYRAVASNSAGSVSSTPATLTVAAVAPPAASWQTAGLIEIDNLGDALGPQVAFNSAGDGMAVWYQFDGTRNNIWANRYVASTGWGTATLIEADPGDAGVPQVAIDVNGNAMAVWQQRDVNGRNNIWANRYLAGTGWGTPTAIETNGPSAGDDQLSRIAMDTNGNVIAVWELSSFSSTTIWANRFVPGAGWGAAIQIGSGNPNGNHVTPQVAVDAVGNAFVVWPQYNGSITNIWGNRFAAGTGWGTAGLVQSDSASSGRDPKIAADANGNAMLVWAQFDLTTSTDHIWASRYVAGTGWGTATLIQTSNASHQANLPKVTFDAGGNAIAAWNQGAFGSFSIYAARYVAGVGWGAEAVIETHTTGSSAASVSLGMDSGGNALALWQLTDASSFTDIWATRYSVGTGWGTATQIEPGNLRTGQASYPQVAMNGNGQAIAVWQRRNPTRFDIWANTYR